MEFKRCSRCGNFYVTEGNVCPKCCPKDNLEYSTFQSYIQKNDLKKSINTISLDNISNETGISIKNLNRFIGYQGGKNE